jgi:NADH:ubiquinone oxidoreductase subunit 4 (subunit M)
MEFINSHLLSLILFTPTLAAAIVMLLPQGRVKLLRWVALVASLVPLAFTLAAWMR